MKLNLETDNTGIRSGALINGNYQVIHSLGVGSMGVVYACKDLKSSEKLVALKVLHSSKMSSEPSLGNLLISRFRNEVIVSSGINHPNVVRTYEFIREGDLVAFTMEYVDGGNLADKIEAEESLSIFDIRKFLYQICSGVQAIHEAGIVHRDLKPENILFTRDGNVKITDFGVAKMEGSPKLTEQGGVVGTLDYLSPEYLKEAIFDERSDIYSIGMLAYMMITKHSPFEGESVIEIIRSKLRSSVVPPCEISPECPEELSDLVLKALERFPEDRFQNAREMLDELKAISAGSLHGRQNVRLHEKIKKETISLHGASISREKSSYIKENIVNTNLVFAQDQDQSYFPTPESLSLKADMTHLVNSSRREVLILSVAAFSIIGFFTYQASVFKDSIRVVVDFMRWAMFS